MVPVSRQVEHPPRFFAFSRSGQFRPGFSVVLVSLTARLIAQSVSWIPVDVAARVIFEMRNSSAGHLHLAHPRPVSWSTIMTPLADKLGLPVIPYDDWLARLVKSGEGLSADGEVEAMKENPALKIVDFFREMGAAQGVRGSQGIDITLDTSEAERVAPSLSAERLPQLSGEDVDRWVGYWKGVGFL